MQRRVNLQSMKGIYVQILESTWHNHCHKIRKCREHTQKGERSVGGEVGEVG
jgi:hypothetical protein